MTGPKEPKLSREGKYFIALTVTVTFFFAIYAIESFSESPGSHDAGLMIATFVSGGVLTVLSGLYFIYIMIVKAVSELLANRPQDNPPPSSESVGTEQKRDNS